MANKMTEEEIKKQITNIICDLNAVNEDWYTEDEIETAKYQVKYIQGLLELYNNEKSKLMVLAMVLDKQESKIKSLHQELEIQEDGSISKDKIREKIKKLKIECNICELGKAIDCKSQCTIGGTIKALNELLKEGDTNAK